MVTVVVVASGKNSEQNLKVEMREFANVLKVGKKERKQRWQHFGPDQLVMVEMPFRHPGVDIRFGVISI